MPDYDPTKLVPTHQRNLQALREASEVAVEGAKTVARRQAEQVRAGIEDGNALLRDLTQARSPEQLLAIQTAAAKWAMEQGVANSREIFEIMTRSGNDAVDVLTRRVREALEEGLEMMAKGTPRK